MDVLRYVFADVAGSFISNPEYRSGFLAATVIGVVAQLAFKVIYTFFKGFRVMLKPSKIAMTKDGPSALKVVLKSIRTAMGVAMALAIWIVLS